RPFRFGAQALCRRCGTDPRALMSGIDRRSPHGFGIREQGDAALPHPPIEERVDRLAQYLNELGLEIGATPRLERGSDARERTTTAEAERLPELQRGFFEARAET